jgi:hypothetical protein
MRNAVQTLVGCRLTGRHGSHATLHTNRSQPAEAVAQIILKGDN